MVIETIAVVLGGVLLATAGTYDVYFTPEARRLRKQRAQMRGAQRTRIAKATDGQLVRITGVVTLKQDTPPLTAPASGRQCVYYTTRISREELGAGGDASSTRQSRAESQSMSFLLVDESGVAEVNIERATFDATFDYVSSVKPDGKMVANHNALIARNGLSGDLSTAASVSFVLSDAVIEVGETVSVLGRVQFVEIDTESRETPPNVQYRESARPRRISLVAPEGAEIIISDEKSLTKST